MSTDGSRRFTDREVALVLRKASELEERAGAGGGTGLSMQELEQIATEVGISPTLIRKAVQDMDARGERSFLAGGPLAHQSIRGVPGELDQQGVARLVEIVEGTSDHVGVVTEALGGTQWTASDRFRTTQVTITPSDGETRVRVVERATARLRVVAHLVPAWAGFAVVTASVGALDLSSQMIAAAMGVGLAAGGTVGRLIWSHLSRKSSERVDRLASDLSRAAEDEHGG